MSIVFNIFFFTTYIMLVIEIKSSSSSSSNAHIDNYGKIACRSQIKVCYRNIRNTSFQQPATNISVFFSQQHFLMIK